MLGPKSSVILTETNFDQEPFWSIAVDQPVELLHTARLTENSLPENRFTTSRSHSLQQCQTDCRPVEPYG
ncbi:MAG: hypothetical protein KME27_09750 [Lyngbya sp. HA4199-MV5]|jgi:hypothetical protein|nr:hypothetical protein [Lyngbya sp. HA4199-MV5]